MDAIYLELRWTHIAAVIASGVFFMVRGLFVLSGRAHWAMVAPVRFTTYAIDTILLLSALMLVVAIHQYPFVHGWLTVKVLLLVVYIVLGVMALKRGKTPAARAVCYLAALVVYGFMISVARTHHPGGFFYAMLN